MRKVLGLLLVALAVTYCSSEPDKPEAGSEQFREVASDFYMSLAAIQADKALFAVEKMQAVVRQYPQEAAAWANLAVFSMRQGNFEKARERIGKAIDRAPDNAEIKFLAGIIESRQGNVDGAVDSFREAAKLAPGDDKIAFALADELERQGEVENAGEIFKILNSILEKRPENLAVLLEMVRASVKWEDRETLGETMERLAELSDRWPREIKRQFEEIKETILNPSSDRLTFQLAFLQNNLNQLPQFQADLDAIQIPPNQVGFLVTRFTWLPTPQTRVPEADTTLAFGFEVATGDTGYETVHTVSLSDNKIAVELAVKGGNAIIDNNRRLSFPGGSQSAYSVTTIDYDYDFLNDLVFAGDAGFKLYRQQEDSTFSEVTASLGLSRNILDGNYFGSWARDIDLDGDLDLLLSRQEGPLVMLRNNGDGTFEEVKVFESVHSIVNFKWADLDGDADSDAVFIDSRGELTLYLNERSGKFEKVDELPLKRGFDIEVADIDKDGNFDVLVWEKKGISRLYFSPATEKWKNERLIPFTGEDEAVDARHAHLFAADLDNNGAEDILASTDSGSRYWLNNGSFSAGPKEKILPANIKATADLDGNNRLDLIRLNEKQQVERGFSSGKKNYNARVIRPRASGPLGDRRINSFGIGGEMEIRSGLLYSKKMINEPWVHIGLGEYEEAEMLRIIWPNGSSQAEFAELGYGTKIFNEQVLKGSCPWVFTHNGEEMEFVTDFLWRTGLGIRINAQGDANVIHSVDWVKIDGDQLVPHRGKYDVRITADLWETHFFDHVSLMAVDHPAGTEVYVDERFTFPPSTPNLYTLKEPRPVAAAFDENGNDLTETVRHDDREYVDTFELTQYQGIAEDHYLEVDLGEEFPDDRPVRLIARGWIYPTDTSVNIAVSQGSRKAPYPLRLEVPDGKGGWKVARENIGFPAGKSKTMLIDLTGIFDEGVDHRIRLATNMEIYWNQMQWAVEAGDESKVRREKISLGSSELRYRGFSEVHRPGRFLPEQPDYNRVSGTTPMWFDLEGYYTRFGSVDELLAEIDDRYVIMNAGDELRFEFPALDAPPEGVKRDFVLIGDGWVKDGDYNTGYSKTVRPLPYHGMKDYSKAPGPLQDDPVYRKHREDWARYHSRYVTPRPFRSALIFDN